MKQLLIFCILICQSVFAQHELLQSGPMLGYSGFREVMIWVQTTDQASVKVGYFKKGEQERFTEVVKTHKSGDYIAKLYPKGLEYGHRYDYVVYINDDALSFDYPLSFQSQALWQWRSDPPAFSFAIGSCYYANEAKDDRPGKPYGGEYGIFDAIHEKAPDFMMWLGDNMYLRTPDFLSNTGIRHRYRHARSLPELQPLLGSVHHYAIWDDHDYGPNDADRSFVNKQLTESAFNDYWGNPNTDVTGKGGITGQFMWQDVAFFMLDNRYHRAPNKSKSEGKDFLGRHQIDWLIDALRSSRAPFKFVCVGGQTISNAAVYENYATYPQERASLLQRIDDEKIEGVIFLSGDRHHTEISKMPRPESYPLYDITCSPLTSGTHRPKDENNDFLLEDKTYYERNFGIVSVSGPRTDRQLNLTIYNSQGQSQWDFKVSARELRYPRKSKK